MGWSPVGNFAVRLVDWVELNLAWLLSLIKDVLQSALNFLDIFLSGLEPMVFIIVAVIISLLISKRLILSVTVGFLFYIIYWMGYWNSAMVTLNMVLVATFVALLLAIPIGILSAKSDKLEPYVKVIMDFMQTMPAFVYLIPVLIFFSVGAVPGVIATVIFAMPPAVRLTNLGIRQVPLEMNEVADSFGSSGFQKLTKVQMPIAMPSIMAGVNQCIMLALSMVVIASLIGGGGLGADINSALNAPRRIAVPLGFESGLAVVFIAIILDRLTQSGRGKN